jgi:RND family efflux transporter MFP subunit
MSDEKPQPEPLIPALPSGGRSDEAHQPRLIIPPTPPKPRRGISWIAVIAVLGIGILGFFLLRGRFGKAGPTSATDPTVAVEPVDREDIWIEDTIPAEFRAYVEVELNAKVSGFLQKINVDFGDKVKAGQLLAVLEVPELKDELDAAFAAEQRAEADYTNAHLVYTRLVGVNNEHPNLVAQQDIDTAQAKDSVAAAAVAAAKADVGKYQTLFDYTQITAPFDGVVTGRYADPGALIQAGTASDTQARPLVRISDNYRLRLDFPVSVKYVQYIKVGDAVEVQVDSLGGKTFTGVITRFTGKVSAATRTMVTEIEVANPDLEIKPGMYATVVLKLARRPKVLTVPTEAVSTGKKDTVLVVDQDNKIQERVVTVGLETPTRWEVTSGLKEGERVMIGSRSRVSVGQKVEPKTIASTGEENP